MAVVEANKASAERVATQDSIAQQSQAEDAGILIVIEGGGRDEAPRSVFVGDREELSERLGIFRGPRLGLGLAHDVGKDRREANELGEFGGGFDLSLTVARRRIVDSHQVPVHGRHHSELLVATLVEEIWGELAGSLVEYNFQHANVLFVIDGGVGEVLSRQAVFGLLHQIHARAP